MVQRQIEGIMQHQITSSVYVLPQPYSQALCGRYESYACQPALVRSRLVPADHTGHRYRLKTCQVRAGLGGKHFIM